MAKERCLRGKWSEVHDPKPWGMQGRCSEVPAGSDLLHCWALSARCVGSAAFRIRFSATTALAASCKSCMRGLCSTRLPLCRHTAVFQPLSCAPDSREQKVCSVPQASTSYCLKQDAQLNCPGKSWKPAEGPKLKPHAQEVRLTC